MPSTSNSGTGATSTSDAHNHQMQHTHPISHLHTVASHQHNFSHMHNVVAAITIPSQQIRIDPHSHSLNIDPHTHPMEYGIYEGPSAQSVKLTVDGKDVPGTFQSGDEINLVQYVHKGNDGRIQRGMTHTLSITPSPAAGNTDGRTHIDATVFVMTFIRSQGGGDY